MPSLNRVKPAYVCLLGAVLLAWPVTVSAHVKWFVRGDAGHTAPPSYFSFAEPAVQLWVVVILAALMVVLALDRWLPGPPERIATFTGKNQRQITHLFQVLVGLALLVTALRGAIIAPHLEEANLFGLALRFAQGTIGVLLMANKGVPWAAGSLVGVFMASTMLFGFVSSLEYFNFLGIALFLLLSSSPGAWADRWRPYALPLLRVHLAIALGVLAWTEKLIDPSLAIRFLEQNQVNFMKTLGADVFSDRLFVLCAGCSELLFAGVFAIGAVTRINTLALAGFLISSNTYFFLMGRTDEAFLELTGHLPLFAIAMMLILYGSGNRLRLAGALTRRASTAPHGRSALGGLLPANYASATAASCPLHAPGDWVASVEYGSRECHAPNQPE